MCCKFVCVVSCWHVFRAWCLYLLGRVGEAMCESAHFLKLGGLSISYTWQYTLPIQALVCLLASVGGAAQTLASFTYVSPLSFVVVSGRRQNSTSKQNRWPAIVCGDQINVQQFEGPVSVGKLRSIHVRRVHRKMQIAKSICNTKTQICKMDFATQLPKSCITHSRL